MILWMSSETTRTNAALAYPLVPLASDGVGTLRDCAGRVIQRTLGDVTTAWTINDAWVLAAITMRPGATTLTELIATADAIDHNVFTEAEFCRSISRLLVAGLIGADQEADRYWPTEQGSAIRKRWRQGMFTWADAIGPQLERLGQPQDARWSLPQGAFDQAVSSYHAWFARKLGRQT